MFYFFSATAFMFASPCSKSGPIILSIDVNTVITLAGKLSDHPGTAVVASVAYGGAGKLVRGLGFLTHPAGTQDALADFQHAREAHFLLFARVPEDVTGRPRAQLLVADAQNRPASVLAANFSHRAEREVTRVDPNLNRRSRLKLHRRSGTCGAAGNADVHKLTLRPEADFQRPDSNIVRAWIASMPSAITS